MSGIIQILAKELWDQIACFEVESSVGNSVRKNSLNFSLSLGKRKYKLTKKDFQHEFQITKDPHPNTI